MSLYFAHMQGYDLTSLYKPHHKTKHVTKASQQVFDRALFKIQNLLRVAIDQKKGNSCVFKDAYSMTKD